MARMVIVSGILALLFIAATHTSLAQAPSTRPAPPQRGDIVWTFAHEDPIVDLRVGAALATLMEPRVRAPVGASVRIIAVNTFGQALEPLTLQPSDVSLLLRAAGFDQSPPFLVVGPCRIWASPSAAAATTILAQSISGALDSLGVQIQPCALASRPEDAHLLAWVFGDPTPLIPRRVPPTFLGSPRPLMPPAIVRPAAPTTTAPTRLPATGTGAPRRGHTMTYNVAALALTLGATVGGTVLWQSRRRTRRTRRTPSNQT